MAKKKVLGQGVDGRDVVNFNVKLAVKYHTTSNEVVKKEAIVPVQTTNKQIAENIAIEKAKNQLKEFPYIIQRTVEVELKRRHKKEV